MKYTSAITGNITIIYIPIMCTMDDKYVQETTVFKCVWNTIFVLIVVTHAFSSALLLPCCLFLDCNGISR